MLFKVGAIQFSVQVWRLYKSRLVLFLRSFSPYITQIDPLLNVAIYLEAAIISLRVVNIRYLNENYLIIMRKYPVSNIRWRNI